MFVSFFLVIYLFNYEFRNRDFKSLIFMFINKTVDTLCKLKINMLLFVFIKIFIKMKIKIIFKTFN